MPVLRRLSHALLVLALPAGLAAQEAFEGAITYRMTSGNQSVEATFMSKGTLSRLEMTMAGMPGPVAVLMNMESMVTQIIMASMGMYMEMDMSQMAQTAAGQGRTGADNVVIEKTGTADEIAGLRCDNYRISDAGQPEVEACIATGMGWFMGGPANPMARGRGSEAGPNWAAYAKEFRDGMVPLRVRSRQGANWNTIMEATAVDRRPLSDDLFRVPTGLRRMSMPGGRPPAT